MGSARSYPGACGKPAVPLHMDIPYIEKENRSRMFGPGVYFVQKETPKEILNKKFNWKKETISELLFSSRDLWNSLSFEQKKYLAEKYPEFLK